MVNHQSNGTLLDRLYAAAKQQQTPAEIERQRMSFALSTVKDVSDATRAKADRILHAKSAA